MREEVDACKMFFIMGGKLMKVNDILVLRKSKMIRQSNKIFLGTQTFTEVKSETTDKDRVIHDSHNNNLGTQTCTDVKSEVTDRDPSALYNLSNLGTQTITKTRIEETDSDNI